MSTVRGRWPWRQRCLHAAWPPLASGEFVSEALCFSAELFVRVLGVRSQRGLHILGPEVAEFPNKGHSH